MIPIKRALEQALLILNAKTTEARLESEILLSEVIKKNRAYLFAHPEERISPTQWESYQKSLHQRRLGKPIAYLTGFKEFWSLCLKVNEHTLIPRPETELLVELTLERLSHKTAKVLDLGTGCGAIALALAKEKPHWQIDALDCSPEALEVAKENAKTHGISNVFFYQSDWFKQLPFTRYHAILSNPPYVAENSFHLQSPNFEPNSALISGQDGLADLNYIIHHSRYYLETNGLLLLEHGFDQKSAINTILKKLGYKNTHCWQDIQGHDRVTGAYFPGI